uniref:Uncharacterized protein n=1 Tax=Alexandrium andersonii TaxID=327968 RepID=A0A7S2J4N8_9DINO
MFLHRHGSAAEMAGSASTSSSFLVSGILPNKKADELNPFYARYPDTPSRIWGQQMPIHPYNQEGKGTPGNGMMSQLTKMFFQQKPNPGYPKGGVVDFRAGGGNVRMVWGRPEAYLPFENAGSYPEEPANHDYEAVRHWYPFKWHGFAGAGNPTANVLAQALVVVAPATPALPTRRSSSRNMEVASAFLVGPDVERMPEGRISRRR